MVREMIPMKIIFRLSLPSWLQKLCVVIHARDFPSDQFEFPCVVFVAQEYSFLVRSDVDGEETSCSPPMGEFTEEGLEAG